VERPGFWWPHLSSLRNNNLDPWRVKEFPVEQIASVELTSEDPNSPIEFALTAGGGRSWRAGRPGEQVIRSVFDNPLRLRRIWLEFSERDVQRTQEFSLSWSPQRDEPLREIVRQQWNFSPQGRPQRWKIIG
jgi:hypothetical protein